MVRRPGVYFDETTELELVGIGAKIPVVIGATGNTGTQSYPVDGIIGDKGHLSNELSGQLLGRVLHDNMGHILLGHLSKENNYEKLAYETVKSEVTMGDNPYKGNDFPIDIASRSNVSEKYVV